ncbi:hypothetical protein M6B38_135675 [Iris pallida]|uniref:NADH dehydrogenase subunit 1 n=1 Tax=Iris pallida TaxID=29817 RepID=A0AAX6FFU4_IRIPA|nr:hypothetical protein M6B38_135675 [Iris pallida]
MHQLVIVVSVPLVILAIVLGCCCYFIGRSRARAI